MIYYFVRSSLTNFIKKPSSSEANDEQKNDHSGLAENNNLKGSRVNSNKPFKATSFSEQDSTQEGQHPTKEEDNFSLKQQKKEDIHDTKVSDTEKDKILRELAEERNEK